MIPPSKFHQVASKIINKSARFHTICNEKRDKSRKIKFHAFLWGFDHFCQLFNFAEFCLRKLPKSPKKPRRWLCSRKLSFLLFHSASFQRRHYDVMPRFGNCIISQIISHRVSIASYFVHLTPAQQGCWTSQFKTT